MAETSSPQLLPPAAPTRLGSLDAYRGFVMFLMAAELLHIPGVARHFPDSGIWQFLSRNSRHVDWTGCSLHDLIQPSFSFLVGVALPYSLASRQGKGQSKLAMWGHALWRSLVLILLGVFLRSIDRSMTYWTFEDTLSQIGLGYPFLFALGFLGIRWRWSALVLILVGYWLAFACYRLPSANFNDALVNVPQNWQYHLSGFAQHWDINSNAAWAFDTWFLNLFPREKLFVGNSGGYCTLSFIPTLGTMILGLIAGGWIREARRAGEAEGATPWQIGEKLITKLLAAGMVCLALGWLMHVADICPIVKKIWTPSWTLLSGGCCFFLLALFYFFVDVLAGRKVAFPLIVIGMNSIAIYVMVHTMADFIGKALNTHLGDGAFRVMGPDFAPLLHGAATLLILWLILYWMFRRKLFLRI